MDATGPQRPTLRQRRAGGKGLSVTQQLNRIPFTPQDLLARKKMLLGLTTKCRWLPPRQSSSAKTIRKWSHEIRKINDNLESQFQLALLCTKASKEGNSVVAKELKESFDYWFKNAALILWYKFHLECFAAESKDDAFLELIKFDVLYQYEPAFLHFHLQHIGRLRILGDEDSRSTLRSLAAAMTQFGKRPKPHPGLLQALYKRKKSKLLKIRNEVALRGDDCLDAYLHGYKLPQDVAMHLKKRKRGVEAMAIRLVEEALKDLGSLTPLAPDPHCKDIKDRKKSGRSPKWSSTTAEYVENQQPIPRHPNWMYPKGPILPSFHHSLALIELWVLRSFHNPPG